MPIDLSALEETCSLLVPAYGVTHDVSAAKADLDPARCIGPVKDEDETYGMLHRDDWYLLPRGSAHFLFGASALFNDAFGPVGKRHVIRLREAGEPMPAARANTCLMVQGTRTCVRRHQDRCDIFPGYAAWMETSDAHRWISCRSRSMPPSDRCSTKTVSFGRAGRGALYTPLDDGKARILLLDFHIADRDGASPDLLLVWASCTEVRKGGIPHQDPRGERLSDEWHSLILKASQEYDMEHGP